MCYIYSDCTFGSFAINIKPYFHDHDLKMSLITVYYLKMSIYKLCIITVYLLKMDEVIRVSYVYRMMPAIKPHITPI